MELSAAWLRRDAAATMARFNGGSVSMTDPKSGRLPSYSFSLSVVLVMKFVLQLQFLGEARAALVVRVVL